MSALADSRRAKMLYIVHRLLQKLSGGRAALHSYLICAQPLGTGAFDAVREDPGTVVLTVGDQDPLLNSLPRPPAVLRQRFFAGAICHAATVKGEFGGCIWLAYRHYDEDEVRCRYVLPEAPRSVWDFDVYVPPRLRTGRTLGRIWKAVDRALYAQGVHWTFSRISVYNPGSIRAHERMGAQHVGTMTFAVLGSFQMAIGSLLPFFVHVSFSQRHCPALLLEAPLPARLVGAQAGYPVDRRS